MSTPAPPPLTPTPPLSDPKVPAIYPALMRVMVNVKPIPKDKTMSAQAGGYKYRSIDDIYNTLQPVFADAGLVILPHVDTIELTTGTNQQGNVMYSYHLNVSYKIIATADGSFVEATIPCEGRDAGDKALTKALSHGLKNLLIQMFLLPTGDPLLDQTAEDTAKIVESNRKIKELSKAEAIAKNNESRPDKPPASLFTPPSSMTPSPAAAPKPSLASPAPVNPADHAKMIMKELLTTKKIAPDVIKARIEEIVKSMHGLVDEESAILIIGKENGIDLLPADPIATEFQTAPLKLYKIMSRETKIKAKGGDYLACKVIELNDAKQPLGEQFNLNIFDLKDELVTTPIPMIVKMSLYQKGQYWNVDHKASIVVIP